mgnify:CR=1 FL=1
MPLSSSRCIALYNQLQRHLEAGLPLPLALQSAPGADRPQLRQLIRSLEAGNPTDEAFQKAEDAFPAFDRAILSATSRTARLPETLARLAEYHIQRLKARNAFLVAVTYPLILAHIAAFLFPILGMIDFAEGGIAGGPMAYAERVATILLILWGGLGLLWVLFSSSSDLLFKIRSRIPFFGKYQRLTALSHFSFSLGALLDAGFPVDDAWLRAGKLSGSPLLKKAAQSIADGVNTGHRPANLIPHQPAFPPDFHGYLKTAEDTGSVPETLYQLSPRYNHEAQHALKFLWIFLPILVLLIAAGAVAWKIFQFYGQYLEQIESMIP